MEQLCLQSDVSFVSLVPVFQANVTLMLLRNDRIPDVHPALSQYWDHVLWSNVPGEPCCAKANEAVLQSIFFLRPRPGACPHGSGGQTPLGGASRAMPPARLEETGFTQRPASSRALRTWEIA